MDTQKHSQTSRKPKHMFNYNPRVDARGVSDSEKIYLKVAGGQSPTAVPFIKNNI